MAGIIYKINLNKPSNRLDQFAERQKQRRVVAVGFYFGVVLLISALAIYKAYQNHRVISSLKTELNQIQDEIDRLQASSAYLSPEDIYVLAELANNRMTWTEKLDVLGRILPSDVTITELDYDYQTNQLIISGLTKVNPRLEDLDLVMAIVDVIKKDPDFSAGFASIMFNGSSRIKHRNQEIIEFEIACTVG